MLINDTGIKESVAYLPSFSFPSDHRIVRSTLKIKTWKKYEYNKKKFTLAETKTIIPKHKKGEANKFIDQIENKNEQLTESNPQD